MMRTLGIVTTSCTLAVGVSGSLAAAVFHAFDTSKSRGQCTVLPKHLSMEWKFLKWKRPGNRFERLTGFHPADKNLLLNGIRLWMARCGLASSIVVGTYFFVIDILIPKWSFHSLWGPRFFWWDCVLQPVSVWSELLAPVYLVACGKTWCHPLND